MGDRLNKFGKGMQPLNWASRLVKEANDIMYGMAIDDKLSTQSRLDSIVETLDELTKCVNQCIDGDGDIGSCYND